jgi:hypothetical protein
MATYFPGKWIHKVIGAMLLVGVLYAFGPAFVARIKLENFCEQLVAGTSIAELQAQVEARDYDISPVVDGRARIDDVRSFRRPSCDLQVGAQGLTSARYSKN